MLLLGTMQQGPNSRARAASNQQKQTSQRISGGDEVFNTFSVGQILAQTRKDKGASLQQVSDFLNIRKGLLKALEEGRDDDLPGMVYAIGFIKGYADFLGLDGEALVKQYKQERGAIQERVPLDIPAAETESRLPDQKILMIAGGLLILIGMVLYFILAEDSQKQQVVKQTPDVEAVFDRETLDKAGVEQVNLDAEIDAQAPNDLSEDNGSQTDQPIDFVQDLKAAQEKQSEQEVQSTTSNDLNSANARATIYGAGNVDHRVAIEAERSSWVEITNDKGDVLLSRVMKKGDQYYVPVNETTILTTGNAGGLKIYVDGEYAGLAGRAGEVLRNYEITPDGLIKLED